MRPRGASSAGRRRAVATPTRRRAGRQPRRATRKVGLFAVLVTTHVAALAGGALMMGSVPSSELALPEAVIPAPVTRGADVRGGLLPVAPAPLIRPQEPTGPEVPESASGVFAVASGGRTSAPASALTYRVEVEQGLPYDAASFAQAVDGILGDARSWSARTNHDLIRVDGEADLRIVLASPGTTNQLCAPLDTATDRVSCRNRDDVVINAWRWAHGAETFGGDLAAYRAYVVNHEVGHALGHGHPTCPAAGGEAPVMLQQSLDLQGCRANPWPTDAEIRLDFVE